MKMYRFSCNQALSKMSVPCGQEICAANYIYETERKFYGHEGYQQT